MRKEKREEVLHIKSRLNIITCKNIDIIAVNYAIRIGWCYEITFRNITFVHWLCTRWDLQSICCVNEIALSRYLEIIRVGRVLEVMRIPRRRYLRYSNWNIIFGIVDGCYFFDHRQFRGIYKCYFRLYVKDDSHRNAVRGWSACLSIRSKRRKKRKRVVAEKCRSLWCRQRRLDIIFFKATCVGHFAPWEA